MILKTENRPANAAKAIRYQNGIPKQVAARFDLHRSFFLQRRVRRTIIDKLSKLSRINNTER